jgi:hypothetical protein
MRDDYETMAKAAIASARISGTGRLGYTDEPIEPASEDGIQQALHYLAAQVENLTELLNTHERVIRPILYPPSPEITRSPENLKQTTSPVADKIRSLTILLSDQTEVLRNITRRVNI